MYQNFLGLIDFCLALTLFFTILYLSKIKKDINNIRYYQKDLYHFSDHFSEAIKRSEHTLKGLYAQKDAFDKDMKKALKQAETLLDDLKYATERAENTFRKLSHVSHTPPHEKETPLILEEPEPSFSQPASPRSHGRTVDMHSMAHHKRKEALRKVLSKLRS